MQAYIDKIVSTTNKLKGIGFGISDEWLVAILLAGLTDEYRPFIMSLEANDSDLSADSVVSKLLDVQISTSSKGDALLSKTFQFKKKGKGNQKKRLCFGCGSDQHLKRDCNNKK